MNMAERVKRRRLAKSADVSDTAALPNDSLLTPPHSAQTPIDDSSSWNGFCEVESEPVSTLPKQTCFSHLALTSFTAFFNVMLKNFGVSGVKVQEIVSLEKEILSDLPFVLAVDFLIQDALI